MEHDLYIDNGPEVENRALRISLGYHLQHNHYPPVSTQFIDCAIEAIESVDPEGYGAEEQITLPTGKVVSALEVIEGLHLDFYLDNGEG